MITIYGTNQCRYCVACKEAYDTQRVEYEFVELLDDLQLLKQYINLRDTLEIYEGIQGTGKLGIPLIKCDDEYTRDWKKYLPKRLDNIVKAVIVHDDKLLVKKTDGSICLPGLIVNPGEYLDEELREYLRENGIQANVTDKLDTLNIEKAESFTSIKSYRCILENTIDLKKTYQWIEINKLEEVDFQTADEQIINREFTRNK